MNIYEIDQAILDCIDMETGEVIDVEKLNSLEMERKTKITNVACWIKDLKALNTALKAEEDALHDRRTKGEKLIEQLNNYVLMATGGEKFESERAKISFRHTESVDISKLKSVDDLPAQYVRVKKEPNKTEIKNALKAGAEIDGCELAYNTSVIIK